LATSIITLRDNMAGTWCESWRAASFRGATFYVDTAVRESGRRIVTHQFPKRNIPYAEDLGRRAREFTVRGYLIVYPRNIAQDDRKKRNYLPQRDFLIDMLEMEGPAILQLPLLGAMNVAVVRYRVTEEDKLGGYCTFDMTFVEYGQAPAEGTRDGSAAVTSSAAQLEAATTTGVENKIKTPSPVPPVPTDALTS
jgi:prophage DNA circulation protein